ncbi:MAG: hypothetical protein IH949_12925, partial [Bacteroidetes bacterium]|nr:hypothetical protein [Bacteroidota bacterium]
MFETFLLSFSLIVLDTLGMHYRIEVNKDAYKKEVQKKDKEVKRLNQLVNMHLGNLRTTNKEVKEI